MVFCATFKRTSTADVIIYTQTKYISIYICTFSGRLPRPPLHAPAAAVAAAYNDSEDDDPSHDPQSDDESLKVDWMMKK